MNVDDDFIYLTNTGNWSETKMLEEKAKGKQKGQTVRRIRISLFFWVIAILVGGAFVINLINSISFLSIVSLPVGIFVLYRYFQNEMGPAFCIPKSKILAIDIAHTRISIQFINGDGIKGQVELHYIDPAAMDFLLVNYSNISHSASE
ncbi:MAG: hypothetical protein KDC92_00170 [Bacteroidetes bacterium]|nr:hypothetical protein [Bacteroidota bacterium]